MKEPSKTNERIDRELTGHAISAGRYTVTPFARLRGRWGANGGEGFESGYALLQLTPVRINVRDADGRTEEIALTNASTQALTAMGAIALAVAAVGLLFPIVRKLIQ